MDAAHTATAGTIDQSVIEEALLPPVHQIMEGMPTEHISMGGDEEEQVAETGPENVRKKLRLVNRVRGLLTELTLYEEGFLKVREQHKKKTTKNYLLNLRYLSSKPSLTRHVALQTLYVALGLLGVATLSWLMAEFTTLVRFFMPTAIVFGTAGFVTFMWFVYRTQEQVHFATAHGGSQVLSLLATFGCYRSARRMVPEIIKAAEEASADRLEIKTQHLRAEMQEHYRLRDAGVLSSEACAAGTRRILSSFD